MLVAPQPDLHMPMLHDGLTPAQGMQAVIAVEGAYVSIAQEEQAVACKFELNLPAAQDVQEAAALAAEVYVPCVHSLQLTGPLAPSGVTPKYPAEH
jgi:hypothetical protein